MIVSELIDQLKQFSPDQRVLIRAGGDSCQHYYLDADLVFDQDMHYNSMVEAWTRPWLNSDEAERVVVVE